MISIKVYNHPDLFERPDVATPFAFCDFVLSGNHSREKGVLFYLDTAKNANSLHTRCRILVHLVMALWWYLLTALVCRYHCYKFFRSHLFTRNLPCRAIIWFEHLGFSDFWLLPMRIHVIEMNSLGQSQSNMCHSHWSIYSPHRHLSTIIGVQSSRVYESEFTYEGVMSIWEGFRLCLTVTAIPALGTNLWATRPALTTSLLSRPWMEDARLTCEERSIVR